LDQVEGWNEGSVGSRREGRVRGRLTHQAAAAAAAAAAVAVAIMTITETLHP